MLRFYTIVCLKCFYSVHAKECLFSQLSVYRPIPDTKSLSDQRSSPTTSLTDTLSIDGRASCDSTCEKKRADTASGCKSNVDPELLFGDGHERKKDLIKQDSRLSRRKTDRPRKRRRDSDDLSPVAAHTLNINDHLSDVINDQTAMRGNGSSPSLQDDDDSMLSTPVISPNLSNSPDAESAKGSQMTPEDLSLRNGIDRVNGNTVDGHKPTSKTTDKIVSNTVHELEKAMSRHLPPRNKSNIVDAAMRLEHHWTSPFQSLSPGLQNMYNNSLYANRESVIRTRNNASSTPGHQLSPDHLVNKDQLHLHIPHISFHNRQKLTAQSDTMSLEEMGLQNGNVDGAHDKCLTVGFMDSDADSDPLGLRTIQRNPKFSFPALSDTTDGVKQPYLSVPNYQYINTGLSQYSHTPSQPIGSLFEPKSANNFWIGGTYPT